MDNERGTSGPVAPPTIWPYRLAEAAGVIIFVYGLATNAIWIILLGVVIFAGSYVVYNHNRRQKSSNEIYAGDTSGGYSYDHRRDDDRDDRSDSDSGGDGGGDGGGGD
jgi:hypothetical protein